MDFFVVDVPILGSFSVYTISLEFEYVTFQDAAIQVQIDFSPST